jgi:DNA adenine methylase
MKILPPLIKWTGSKRSQVPQIQKLVPNKINTYFEPFVGGANVVGNLVLNTSTSHRAGDIIQPLIGFYESFQSYPNVIFDHYAENWELLQTDTSHFYVVRERFNKEKNPADFFFLSRTSHNGLIRFNSKGEFNASVNHSPNRNKGIAPGTLSQVFAEWKPRLADVKFECVSYDELLQNAQTGDWVYMDPPYLSTAPVYGTSGFVFADFIKTLERLNEAGVQWVCSYNGGDNSDLQAVSKHHIQSLSGQSSFRKLQKKNTTVFESLYLNYVSC